MSAADAARERARQASGQFGEQQHSDPEVALAGSRQPDIGSLVEFQTRGHTRTGIDNGDGTSSHFTTRDGRVAVNIVEIPVGAKTVAPAGSERAASLASDLRGAPGSQNVGQALLAAIGKE